MTGETGRSREEELEHLHQILRLVQTAAHTFSLYEGENLILDMLLRQVRVICKNLNSPSARTSAIDIAMQFGAKSDVRCQSWNYTAENICPWATDAPASSSSSESIVNGGSTSPIEATSENLMNADFADGDGSKDADVGIGFGISEQEMSRDGNLEVEIGKLRKIFDVIKQYVTDYASSTSQNLNLGLFLQELDQLWRQSRTATVIRTSPSSDFNHMTDAFSNLKMPSSLKVKKRRKKHSEDLSRGSVSFPKKVKQAPDARFSIFNAAATSCVENGSNAHTIYNGRKAFSQRNTNDEMTPMEKVFTTDLTTLKILSYLDVPQLKTLRLVHPHFNTIALDVLPRRSNLKVIFKFDWSTKTYVSSISNPAASSPISGSCSSSGSGSNSGSNSDHPPISIRRSLHDLTTLLKTSERFPTDYFTFSNGTLSSYDIQEFLRTQGHRVKRFHIDLYSPPDSLSLNYSNNSILSAALEMPLIAQDLFQQVQPPNYDELPTSYCLRILLETQLPNLETLELDNIPKIWSHSSNKIRFIPDGTIIPNLKTLKVPNALPGKIMKDLLEACVNLREVRNYSNLKILCKVNKLHLLKVVSWQPYPEDILGFDVDSLPPSNLERFGIILDRIDFNRTESLQRISKILTSLLESSAGSLYRLYVATPLGHLPHLRIPLMPKVTTIKVGGVSVQDPIGQAVTTYFPPGFQLASAFPNLYHVIFEFHLAGKSQVWEVFFGNYAPVQSVRYLEVTEKCSHLPMGWVGRFAQIFPCVDILNIQARFFNFPYDARGIWNFDKLKVLKLRINVLAGFNRFPAIDAAFTGFTEETCVSLQDQGMLDKERADELRENPSLVNLTGLRSLRITFADSSTILRIHEYPIIISHIAGMYAFRTMRNLRVAVETEVGNRLNAKRLWNSLSHMFTYVHTHKSI